MAAPRLTWLGQGGFALASAHGIRMLVDPYVSNAAARVGLERLLPSPVDLLATPVDLVCITHPHLDHLDPEAVPAWLARGATLVAPPSVMAQAPALSPPDPGRLRTVRPGDRVACGDVAVTAVYARHTEDSVGFVCDLDGFRWYVTGDTLPSRRLVGAHTRACTLLSVCINGRLGNMGPRSAARLARSLGAAWAMPMHWGMFARNTRDPGEFLARLREEAPGTRGLVMEPFRGYALRPHAPGGPDVTPLPRLRGPR